MGSIMLGRTSLLEFLYSLHPLVGPESPRPPPMETFYGGPVSRVGRVGISRGKILPLMSLTILPLIAASTQGTDLAIEKVVLGDASVTAGEVLEVTTVVRNLGPTQYAGEFDLLYYVDGKMVERVRWNASKYRGNAQGRAAGVHPPPRHFGDGLRGSTNSR